jgi:hypothetical protein
MTDPGSDFQSRIAELKRTNAGPLAEWSLVCETLEAYLAIVQPYVESLAGVCKMMREELQNEITARQHPLARHFAGYRGGAAEFCKLMSLVLECLPAGPMPSLEAHFAGGASVPAVADQQPGPAKKDEPSELRRDSPGGTHDAEHKQRGKDDPTGS